MKSSPRPVDLAELPLWRLIVLLDDTERMVGSDCDSAKVLARIIREKMREEPRITPSASEVQHHG